MEQELTAKERTATQSLVKEQEQLQLDELPTTLGYKRETLKQLKRKATSLAEIAGVNSEAAQELKGIEI